MTDARVSLCREGIVLDGRTVPLLAGSVHYWRLSPGDWRSCLQAVADLGLKLVDVYVPWAEHELEPGVLDFGRRERRRDVARFLRIAEELGLYAIVRPGPHINAELTYFGIPERVVWDPACQAKSPKGNPVMLPVLPKMFPVPSYASSAYHDEVRRYFRGVGEELAGLCYPHGPIVMVQVDNEGALFFRDGAFDQDYHPDAIALYRDFLRNKYGTIGELQQAYQAYAARLTTGEDAEPLRFADLEPPRRLEAEHAEELVYYLDWVEFQESLLAGALARFSDALTEAGFGTVVRSHNFPMAHETTPLNAGRIGQAVDLVGFDYYHDASERTRSAVARRTSELAARSDALGVPAFAGELGAGFPPYFPALSEQDSAFTALVALAYGLRGFNLYMAVERDRWIGAPIDARGRARPFATFWRTLCEAIERVELQKLRRRVPVRLLVPRIERRLARVLHAFGPASGALLSVLGQGARESCVEDDLELGYPLAVEADSFVRAFEAALEHRGIPFAVVAGEDREHALAGASWVVCATSGCMSPALVECLLAAQRAGARVSVGPRLPRMDGSLRVLERPALSTDEVELIEHIDPASADAAVSRAALALSLPSHAAQPEGVQVTVHEDEAGRPRAVFVINSGDEDLVAKVTLGVDGAWQDPFDGTATRSERGLLEVRVRPRTVRMLLERK